MGAPLILGSQRGRCAACNYNAFLDIKSITTQYCTAKVLRVLLNAKRVCRRVSVVWKICVNAQPTTVAVLIVG
jgi:hypothetical protein